MEYSNLHEVNTVVYSESAAPRPSDCRQAPCQAGFPCKPCYTHCNAQRRLHSFERVGPWNPITAWDVSFDLVCSESRSLPNNTLCVTPRPLLRGKQKGTEAVPGLGAGPRPGQGDGVNGDVASFSRGHLPWARGPLRAPAGPASPGTSAPSHRWLRPSQSRWHQGPRVGARLEDRLQWVWNCGPGARRRRNQFSNPTGAMPVPGLWTLLSRLQRRQELRFQNTGLWGGRRLCQGFRVMGDRKAPEWSGQTKTSRKDLENLGGGDLEAGCKGRSPEARPETWLLGAHAGLALRRISWPGQDWRPWLAAPQSEPSGRWVTPQRPAEVLRWVRTGPERHTQGAWGRFPERQHCWASPAPCPAPAGAPVRLASASCAHRRCRGASRRWSVPAQHPPAWSRGAALCLAQHPQRAARPWTGLPPSLSGTTLDRSPALSSLPIKPLGWREPALTGAFSAEVTVEASGRKAQRSKAPG